jgi:tryptophanyl-tRNA synthetase
MDSKPGVVDAYKVEGKIDYDQFAKSYGLKLIDEDLDKRLEKYAGNLHFLVKRRIFYAQREMGWLIDEFEKGNKFYVYTGRAPSGEMHIGHLLPFTLARWLQEKFRAEVYIQIPDEEKFLAKDGGKDPDAIKPLAMDNVLDIIALGFKPGLTKIFLDTEYAKTMYKQAVRVSKHITFSTMQAAFGFGNDTNIGKIFYTSMQAVPAFLKSVEAGKNVPCVIPLAIDQDVHFRVARDVIGKLGYYKPASIGCKFLPSLDGQAKMSSSEIGSAIYLNDDEETVRKKIGKAFTGQQPTAELQRKHGGDPDKCVVCQYYKYFFEPNDAKLNKILDDERHGRILAGEHKAHLAETINTFLKKHRARRERAKEKLEQFMARD